jgi:hypothetical protein
MLLVQFRNRPHVHRVVNMPAVAGGGFGVAINDPNPVWRTRGLGILDLE